MPKIPKRPGRKWDAPPQRPEGEWEGGTFLMQAVATEHHRWMLGFDNDERIAELADALRDHLPEKARRFAVEMALMPIIKRYVSEGAFRAARATAAKVGTCPHREECDRCAKTNVGDFEDL